MKDSPQDTINVKPFLRLKIDGLAVGGYWGQMADSEKHSGNIQFPKNAIGLRCLNDGGRIEILDPSSASEVLVFKYGAQIVILGTTRSFTTKTWCRRSSRASLASRYHRISRYCLLDPRYILRTSSLPRLLDSGKRERWARLHYTIVHSRSAIPESEVAIRTFLW